MAYDAKSVNLSSMTYAAVVQPACLRFSKTFQDGPVLNNRR